GDLSDTFVSGLGLPGNPVSSMVGAKIFLEPLMRALSGDAVIQAPALPAVLGTDLPANDERADYLRVRVERAGDHLV
ncbi:hypothetical protein J8J27_35690, partial [Mycobacterium tuberculosis]|nr:hypothetical protein [Mycobacterium tuberculosis]